MINSFKYLAIILATAVSLCSTTSSVQALDNSAMDDRTHAKIYFVPCGKTIFENAAVLTRYTRAYRNETIKAFPIWCHLIVNEYIDEVGNQVTESLLWDQGVPGFFPSDAYQLIDVPFPGWYAEREPEATEEILDGSPELDENGDFVVPKLLALRSSETPLVDTLDSFNLPTAGPDSPFVPTLLGVSHLHVDHIGNIGDPRFANVPIIIDEREYIAGCNFTDPDSESPIDNFMPDFVYRQALCDDPTRIVIKVKDEYYHPLNTDKIRIRRCGGHTTGSLCLEVNLKNSGLMIIPADAYQDREMRRIFQRHHPDYGQDDVITYSRDKQAVYDTINYIEDKVKYEGARILYQHDFKQANRFVEKAAKNGGYLD